MLVQQELFFGSHYYWQLMNAMHVFTVIASFHTHWQFLGKTTKFNTLPNLTHITPQYAKPFKPFQSVLILTGSQGWSVDLNQLTHS